MLSCCSSSADRLTGVILDVSASMMSDNLWANVIRRGCRHTQLHILPELIWLSIFMTVGSASSHALFCVFMLSFRQCDTTCTFGKMYKINRFYFHTSKQEEGSHVKTRDFVDLIYYTVLQTKIKINKISRAFNL